MRGREVLEKLRLLLRGVNESILRHPFVSEAVEGRLPRCWLRVFTVNQLYIVHHDLRSLSLMLSRASAPEELRLFKALVEGDYRAYNELLKLAREIGVNPSTARYEANPAAVAYTHYLAWLALYASPGEAAVALLVNLPVWGSNVARLAEAARTRYGVRETGFFEAFAGPYDELEELAEPVIERYMDVKRYEAVARMIQFYEKMFWDAVYEESRACG